ncbi:hypothetical protein AOLI_G00100950 [Acnodon oligacanthus]
MVVYSIEQRIKVMAVGAWLWILGLLTGPVWERTQGLSCTLQSRSISRSLYKEGDVIIGGLFPVHSIAPAIDYGFTQRQTGRCQGVDLRSYLWLQTMIFTVEEINRDPVLLPNFTLGYLAADTCLSEGSTLSTALSLVTGQEEAISGEQCTRAPSVPVIIGDARSSASIVVADTLGVFGIPMVSYYASCACLSDRKRFQTFLRTIPSNALQAKIMARLLRFMGWSWVGVVYGDDAYGESSVQLLQQELEGSDVCMDYLGVISKAYTLSSIRQIVERIQSSKAQVVMILAISPQTEVLLREVVKQNVTNRQWIAVPAWSTSSYFALWSGLSLGGTIGLAQRNIEIKGLRSYLMHLNPGEHPKEQLVQDVWEELFGCRFGEEILSGLPRPQCTGLEKMQIQVQETMSDGKYNVYKAVYAIAYAIQDMLDCQPGKGPFKDGKCPDIKPINPEQLLHYLKAVKFTTPVGELVYFDQNGEPPISSDIINWHIGSDGKLEFVIVGQFDAAKGPDQDLQLDLKKVIWGGGWGEKILSVNMYMVYNCQMMAVDAWLWALGLLAGPVWVHSLGLSCALQSRSISGSLYKEGDVIIGGLFPVHIEAPEPDHTFTQRVQDGRCRSVELRSYRWLQTMIFTVEEINRNPVLLPNLTLGYLATDTCLSEGSTLSAALSIVTGQDEAVTEQCTKAPNVPVIIGDARSSASIVVADTLGVFGIPMVSYFASCACLSDRTRYPTFLRTVPSDAFQAKAMARLLRQMDWSWVGVVYGDDAYGKSGVQLLIQELERSGVCVDYIEVIPKSHALSRIKRIVERIQSSKAQVVVTFAISPDMEVLLKEVVRQNATDRQWIATEAWSTSTHYSAWSGISLVGTLGFALRRVDIQGLGSYLTQLSPEEHTKDQLVQNVWEEVFGCKFGKEMYSGPHCTGLEKVEVQGEAYFDVMYNVYKAVYAIANAIQDMLDCQPGKGPFKNGACPDINPVRPEQLLYYLKRVKFTTPVGELVNFDNNGDPSASYDIINWHMGAEGKVEFVKVGQFDAARGPQQDFQLDLSKVVWGGSWSDKVRVQRHTS